MARTARQRAALRKAQLASAAKRRGKKALRRRGITGAKRRKRKLTPNQKRRRAKVLVGMGLFVAASTQAGGIAGTKVGNAYIKRRQKRMAQALNFDLNGQWKSKSSYGIRWL